VLLVMVLLLGRVGVVLGLGVSVWVWMGQF
jgi:hypothetical protein